MKKTIAIALALALCLPLAACGNSSSGGGQQSNATPQGGGQAPEASIRLIMGGTNTESNVLTMADRYFIDLVSERTGGRLEIEYHANNVLGGDRALVDSILAGSVDLAQCSSSNFSQYSNALDFVELPGLFASLDHYYAVLGSDAIMDPVIDRIEEETGLTILCARNMSGEPRALIYRGSPIRVPADCTGRMLRTTGSAVEVALFKALGIAAQTVEYSECYTAIQQNMVEGMYLQPNVMVEGMFQEVVDNATYINESYVTHLIVASASLKDKIGEELYSVLCECIDESLEWSKGQWADVVTASHETIDGAVNGIYPTEEEQALWDEVSASIWDQFIGVSVTQEQLDAIAALK